MQNTTEQILIVLEEHLTKTNVKSNYPLFIMTKLPDLEALAELLSSNTKTDE